MRAAPIADPATDKACVIIVAVAAGVTGLVDRIASIERTAPDTQAASACGRNNQTHLRRIKCIARAASGSRIDRVATATNGAARLKSLGVFGMHHSRFRDSMMQYTTASCVLDQRPMCPRRASKVNGQAASCARPRSQPSRFRKKRQTATQRRTKAMPATRYFSKPSPKSPKGMTTWAAAGVMTAAKETTRRE